MNIDVTSKQTRAEFYGSGSWRAKREEILKRDNYECQWCKAEGRVTATGTDILEVDHIQELKDRPDLAFDNDNLRTLCKDCHNRRHGRMNYKHTNKKVNKWAEDEKWE